MKGITVNGNDVIIKLSDPKKNFIVSDINNYEIAELIEKICQGIDKADGKNES